MADTLSYPPALLLLQSMQILFCALLRLPIKAALLNKLFGSIKNCGLTPEEQSEYFELCMSELDPEARQEVQALMNNGKTFFAAMNSFRGKRNGEFLC
jgi:hypothetical protein